MLRRYELAREDKRHGCGQGQLYNLEIASSPCVDRRLRSGSYETPLGSIRSPPDIYNTALPRSISLQWAFLTKVPSIFISYS